MAITNFIPEVWSARLEHRLQAWSAFRSATNTEYEGDVSAYGDTVRIFSLDDNITVKDYTRNSDIDAPETLNTTEQTLTIQQQKYFNMAVDDLDARQARASLIDVAVDNTVRKVGLGIDAYVAGKLTAIGGSNLGLNKSRAAFNLNFVNEIKEWARKNNLPTASLRVMVPPEVVRKIEDGYIGNTYGEYGIQRGFGTPEDPVTNSGAIGSIAGLEFYVSNDDALYTKSGQNVNGLVVYAFDRRDVALVSQVASVEAYRPEKRFADAVKGVFLYDAKVLKEGRILKYQFTL